MHLGLVRGDMGKLGLKMGVGFKFSRILRQAFIFRCCLILRRVRVLTMRRGWVKSLASTHHHYPAAAAAKPVHTLVLAALLHHCITAIVCIYMHI